MLYSYGTMAQLAPHSLASLCPKPIPQQFLRPPAIAKPVSCPKANLLGCLILSLRVQGFEDSSKIRHTVLQKQVFS